MRFTLKKGGAGGALAEPLSPRLASTVGPRESLDEAGHDILSQALAQTSEAILILDRELRVGYTNAAFSRLTGYESRELANAPVTVLGPPPLPELPSDPPGFEALIRERGSVGGEGMLPTKTGGSIPAYITISPVSDAGGNFAAYVITHFDLRPVKQAEALLHESEERFRAISSAARDATLVIDDAGGICFWNNAASHLFGYSAEEAFGKDAHLFLIPARYHEAYIGGWPRFAREGQGPVVGKILTSEGRRKDGTEFPVEVSVSAFNLRGHWHAVGVIRDITERKQAEHQLQLFRDLLDNSNDAIEVIDPETMRFLDVNGRECRDLGYSREELLSMTVADIDPGFEPTPRDIVNLQIQGPGTAVFERLHQRKDGSTFPVEVSARLIEAGGKTYLLSIARDITERKRAEDILRRTNRALRTISASNMTLVRATEEQQLLADMCRAVVEQGGYHLAWVGFKEDDEEKSVRRVASAGCDAGCMNVLQLNWADNEHGRTPASRALRQGTPQTVRNIFTEPQAASLREHALACGYASCLALPLKDDGNEVFGVLKICAVEPDGFDEDETRLLQELAGDVAFGVQNLRTRQQCDHLEQENLRNLERVKGALLGTVSAVAHMAEQRDPYTAGHQNRVARLACAIANELGLDADRIEGLRLGAMIHDIGKIAMPAEILNRPGRLTAPELEILKSHAQAGYEIIKEVDFPWPVAEMVLQHHERLDGSGYPRGLRGDDICLEARIIGIADAVDAVCAHRPYRPALGLEKALTIIEAGSGQVFDTDAANACLRLFREKGYVLGDETEHAGEEEAGLEQALLRGIHSA